MKYQKANFFALLKSVRFKPLFITRVNAKSVRAVTKLTSVVKWIQWSARSLNLVGACDVNCSTEANISDWSKSIFNFSSNSPLALEIYTRLTWNKLEQMYCAFKKTYLFLYMILMWLSGIIQVENHKTSTGSSRESLMPWRMTHSQEWSLNSSGGLFTDGRYLDQWIIGGAVWTLQV